MSMHFTNNFIFLLIDKVVFTEIDRNALNINIKNEFDHTEQSAVFFFYTV